MAVATVADQINQIQNILAQNNVQKIDIETQAISISPQYDYPNGVQAVTGQNAQQTLTATIRKINKNGGNLGTLIDQLSAVNGVIINGLNFDKADSSAA